jgi:hypothetical protein
MATEQQSTSIYATPFTKEATKNEPTNSRNELHLRKRTFTESRATKFEAACRSMLERKKSNNISIMSTDEDLNDQKKIEAIHDVKELGLMFSGEDRKPVFCWATFVEEVFCQTSFSLLGPIAILWIVPICGVYGARITGFFPGNIPIPDEEKKRREEAAALYGDAYKPPSQNNAAMGVFIFQIVFWAVCYVPVIFWIFRYASGEIVPISPGETFNATGTNAAPTQVYPIAEIALPLMIYILRQVIISIKYSFRARRTMRKDRNSGRDMSEWGDDMLGSFILSKPSPESLARELDRSAWRAGVHLHMISLELEDELSDDMIQKIDVPERTLKKIKIVDSKDDLNSKPCEKDVYLSKLSSRFLNVRSGIKYVTSLATNIGPPSFVNFATLVGMCIPFLYRIAHGDAAFGDSHFDRWVSITNIFRLGDAVSTMCNFSIAASILFDRQRMALDSWFELLIPSSIPDARDVPHQATKQRKQNLLALIPDMKITTQNIFSWNMGRKVLRKIGYVYYRRLNVFLGLFLVLLAFTVIYFVVDILIAISRKETVVVSAGFIMILFFSFMVISVFFKIVFSGMFTNRQMKLHAASIKHYKTRLETVSSCRIHNLRSKHDGTKEHDANIKKIQSEAKEIQRALKLVADEIESEAETEKIRILGVNVDATMLEGLLGLLSALGVTLWQAFMQS